MARKSEEMGTVKFNSDKIRINRPVAETYAFLSDLNNFEKMMPDQVINWQSTIDHCTFTIKNMATIGLKVEKKMPNQQVSLASDGKVPFDFELNCKLKTLSESSTEVFIELNADLSPMFKMMASNPLRNLVNIMAKKLGEELG